MDCSGCRVTPLAGRLDRATDEPPIKADARKLRLVFWLFGILQSADLTKLFIGKSQLMLASRQLRSRKIAYKVRTDASPISNTEQTPCPLYPPLHLGVTRAVTELVGQCPTEVC